MALLFVKSLLMPREKAGQYARLRPDSPVKDIEQCNYEKSAAAAAAAAGGGEPTPLRARLNARLISDATIGLSDGLTVPFALTAGLSALGETRVVIYGGLAELLAGGISMGLGGYMGARSEAEGYRAARAATRAVVAGEPARAAGLVRGVFARYDGVAEEALRALADGLRAEPEQMVDFLLRFHHQLAEADYAPARAYVSGVTIAVGYVCGGLVALLPYLFLPTIHQAFVGSVVLMVFALFTFGWMKTALVGETDRRVCFANGVQMMVLGGVAAAAAMGCVKAIA